MFLSIIFFVLVTHVGPVMPGELKPKNIFLLAGQSNMTESGGVYNDTKTNLLNWDGKIPPQCTPTPNILTLSINKTWEIPHDPLRKEIHNLKTCGVGLGMPFSKQILAKHPNYGVIGLVPCAIEGTKIEMWQKGTNLYNQLVDRARAARQSSGGNIRALLWYQGKSDCGEQDSRLYTRRLEKFFKNVRHDLDSPDLPILMVIVSTGPRKSLRFRRYAQLNINLKNVMRIESVGSTFLADHLLLDTNSAVGIGQKVANNFLYSFYHWK